MARTVEGPWFRSSKNSWFATVNGKKVNLRVKGEHNKSLAVKAWHALMAGGSAPDAPEPAPRPPQAARVAPEAAPAGVSPAVTVKAVAAAFLADAAGRCKPESMAVYRSALNRLAKKFGTRPAPGLKPFEVEAFANRPGVSASTKNTFLPAVVTAFRWAVRAGVLPANPLTGLRKPPCGSRGASAVLTADQFARLHESASPTFAPFLMGLWLTGCRPGELAGMAAGHVDFGTGVAVLSEHKTAGKTGRPRLVYLSAEAMLLFKGQADKHPTGPLFPNKLGGAFNRFTIQKAMEVARTKAGVPHAIAYAMRHSYATRALVAGVPDATVAALLGHSGTAMLHKHYSHLTSQARAMREAAGRVRG